MCHGSLPTELNWLQQWLRIKQDYLISLQVTFLLHLFLFFFFFFPLFFFTLKRGHFEQYEIIFCFVSPSFCFFWCSFCVVFLSLIMLQLLLESSVEAREAAMMGTAQTAETIPPAFQYRNKGTEKGADLTPSECIPALLSFPVVSCSCPLPYYRPYTALQLSAADCESADTGKTRALHVRKPSYESLIIPRTQ